MKENLLNSFMSLYNDYMNYKCNDIKSYHHNNITYVEFIDIQCIPSVRLHHNDSTLDLSLYFLDCLDEKDIKNLFENFILTSN